MASISSSSSMVVGRSLGCRVVFSVTCERAVLRRSQEDAQFGDGKLEPCLLGNIPALGNWSPDHAIELKNTAAIVEHEQWQADVAIPFNTSVVYRYALRSSATKALVRWESFPHGRTLAVTDAATITTEGEVLGQLPLHHICRRRGTRRWLDGRVLTAASGSEMRLTFGAYTGRPTILLDDNTASPTPLFMRIRLHERTIAGASPSVLPTVVCQLNRFTENADDEEQRKRYETIGLMPLVDRDTVSFRFNSPHVRLHNISARIEIFADRTERKVSTRRGNGADDDSTARTAPNIVSSEDDVQKIGESVISMESLLYPELRLKQQRRTRGAFTSSLYAVTPLRQPTPPPLTAIGTVYGEFTLVDPWVNPANNISEVWRRHWKPRESLDVGHRGLGRSFRKLPGQRRPSVTENTLQSFAAACLFGAEFIELDVMLSKDRVPVIFHDFDVGATASAAASNGDAGGELGVVGAQTGVPTDSTENLAASIHHLYYSQLRTLGPNAVVKKPPLPPPINATASLQAPSTPLAQIKSDEATPAAASGRQPHLFAQANAAGGHHVAAASSSSSSGIPSTPVPATSSSSNGATTATPAPSSLPILPIVPPTPSVTLSLTVPRNNHLSGYVRRHRKTIFRMKHRATTQDLGYIAPLAESIMRLVPTMAEVLTLLPPWLGINIEIKYPINPEVEWLGYSNEFELNAYLDTILAVVFACAGQRRIFFSCFHADAAMALQLKQSRYPVYFLTCGGDPDVYCDHRNNSLERSFTFARVERLPGIVSNCSPLFAVDKKSSSEHGQVRLLGQRFIELAHAAEMRFITWGDQNSRPIYYNLQRQWGADAIISDNIGDLTRGRGKMDSIFRKDFRGTPEEKRWQPSTPPAPPATLSNEAKQTASGVTPPSLPTIGNRHVPTTISATTPSPALSSASSSSSSSSVATTASPSSSSSSSSTSRHVWRRAALLSGIIASAATIAAVSSWLTTRRTTTTTNTTPSRSS